MSQNPQFKNLLKFRDENLLVAVSGGSDSLAMLHLLLDAGFTGLTVASVDHGLRPESASEVQAVAAHCAEISLPHVKLKIKVPAQGNLQANAREARYRVLADQAKLIRAKAVMIGHTLDDVVETFFLNAYRGSGIEGLSAMKSEFWRDGVLFLRPLLEMRRQNLRAYLGEHSISWIDDPSNEREEFDRVRLRKLLARAEVEGFRAERIALSAKNLHNEREALELQVQKFFQIDAFWLLEGVQLAINSRAFFDQPNAIQFRILSSLLKYFGRNHFAPRKIAFEALINNLRSPEFRAANLSGTRVEKRRGHIYFSAELASLPLPAKVNWHLWQSDESDILIGPLGENAQRDETLRRKGLSHQAMMSLPILLNQDPILSDKPDPRIKLRIIFPYELRKAL